MWAFVKQINPIHFYQFYDAVILIFKTVNMYIKIFYEGTELKGKVIKREAYFLKVQLIEPFVYCPVVSYISGMVRNGLSFNKSDCLQDTLNFKLTHSYEVSRILNENLDRLLKVYVDYTNELEIISTISDSDLMNRIKKKLTDWYFSSMFNDIIIPYNEREYIFTHLDMYRGFLNSYQSIL